MRLHQVGAAQAVVVAFRSDGAPWIWERLEWVIRRAINLRMKGNSVFRKEENAEAMLVLRGLVQSGQWKPTFAKISESMARDRRLEWKWQSPDMPAQLKAKVAIEPPKPQMPSAKRDLHRSCVVTD